MKHTALLALLFGGCATQSTKTQKAPDTCISPLISVVNNQLRVIGENYPPRFSVYHFIIPKDESTRLKMNNYVILSTITYTQQLSDLPIHKVSSVSQENKRTYEYPSIFEFPITKNVTFISPSGVKHDYLEQDIHSLMPLEHLNLHSLWEIEMNQSQSKIPLFSGPLSSPELSALQGEKRTNPARPDLSLAAQIVFETYCLAKFH